MGASDSSVPTEWIQRSSSWQGIPNDKTGTVTTCIFHIATAVVGAGILALPNAVAYLGWVAGPLLIVIFFLVSLYASLKLADVYEVNGIEHSRYHHLIRHILSRRSAIIVSTLQLLQIVLIAIAYTITGATSVVDIAQICCEYAGYTPEQISTTGICLSPTTGGQWKVTLMFGALVLVLSQLRNIEDLWPVSALATLASFTYAIIALILCVANANNRQGTVGGIPVGYQLTNGSTVTTADKVFGAMNALGSISFAYGFSIILLEIQDTLHQPPAASTQMKKAVNVAVSGAFCFYFVVSVCGYAALGNSVQPIVLQSFSNPRWAMIIANFAVLVHMAGAYSLFMQAVFNTVESHIKAVMLRHEQEKEQNKECSKTIKEEESITSTSQLELGVRTQAVGVVEDTPSGDASYLSIPSPFADTPDSDQQIPSQQPNPIGKSRSRFGFDHIGVIPSAEDGLSRRLTTHELCAVAETQSMNLMVSYCRKSTETRIILPMSSKSQMFAPAIGLSDEGVPLNEHGVLIPFKYRFVMRSICVIIITVIAACLPFFSAFLGVVGTISFFPLTIHFPFACYRKVRSVTTWEGIFMWIIWALMGIVCAVTLTASIRTIIVSASTFRFFGT